ncbi:MAG TPA: hypothetical protein EYN79_01310 [Planctomycetes bacterium]|nr:hypothetical protein [Planctomycetota bacterium]
MGQMVLALFLVLACGCDMKAPLASPETKWHFVEIAAAGGIDQPQLCGVDPPEGIIDVKSTGAALFDLDGDDLLDIFLTSGSTTARFKDGKPGFTSRVWRNLGGMRFEEVTEASGIPPISWASGAAAADIDGDGDDDLLITTIGRDRLFLNQDGRLLEVEDSGIDDSSSSTIPGWSTSAAFGDLDGDGDLDLYICRYLEYDFDDPPVDGERWSCLWKNHVVICGPRGLPARNDGVYENIGNGRFREVTSEWGFDSVEAGYGLAVVIVDLIGDFRPEVFVANDSSPNFLFVRDDEGRWHDEGFLSGLSVDEDGQEQAGMGIGCGDLDGDGTLDLVVSNFEEESSNLYLNSGRGTFTDECQRRGIAAASRPALSWGVGVRDFDHDGLADIFFANGHVYPQADEVPTSPGYRQRDQIFVAENNSGKLRYRERGEELGLLVKHSGRAAAFADLDGDGDIDIISSSLNGKPHLWQNHTSPTRSWLLLELVQEGSNRQGIGAIVTIEGASTRQRAALLRQHSFQASSSPRLHFGCGDDRGPFKATVIWPDGSGEVFDLATAGNHRLERGKGEAVPR